MIFFNRCAKFASHNRLLLVRFYSDKCTTRTTTALEWPNKGFELKDLKSIESHWSKNVKRPSFKRNYDSKAAKQSRKYILSMFPYPSGSLHMGHVRVYTIADCLARYEYMIGGEVFQPMGWDSFGLPAENAAREKGVDPKIWTQRNIAEMRSQLERLGCCFNWEAELTTSDPSYYKWSQFLFIKLFEAGLASRKLSSVNWDPVDCTVLADEQIDELGRSWRSGAKAEKKLLKQWFIRTSRFAEDLYDELEKLKDWHEIVPIQKNWIGQCDGYKFHLPVKGANEKQDIELFVQNPDDFKEKCFIIVNTQHVLAKDFLDDYKTGSYKLLPIGVVHPCSEATHVISVVLTDVPMENMVFDAKLAMPTSCEKDLVVCQKAGLEINNLPKFENVDVLEETKKRNFGGYKCSDRSVDWVVSRQRYWGTPIPIVHCHKCGEVPVPEQDLPVVLPEPESLDVESLKSSGSTSPLQSFTEWVNTECPKCGAPAKRECDTLDTFFDSCWYFLRYVDSKNDKTIFSREKIDKWLPVDVYVGGREHAVMHLYFARFITHFLHDQGLVGFKEPFKRLLPQGMVKGKTYLVEGTGRYVRPEDVVETENGVFLDGKTGEPVLMTWEKMSKSKYNGVNPMDTIDKYGTDMTRLITIAGGSPQQDKLWATDISKGLYNWLYRIWWIVSNYVTQIQDSRGTFEGKLDQKLKKELDCAYNEAVRQATFHMNTTHLLNVVISRLQALTNVLRKVPVECMGSTEFERCLCALLVMLYPFAPHTSIELWTTVRNVQQTADVQHQYQPSADVHGVQEFAWPIIDADSDLELEFKEDVHTITKMTLPRSEMENLTEEKALNLANNHAKLKKVLKTKRIEGGTLTFVHDYGAMLWLQIGSGDNK